VQRPGHRAQEWWPWRFSVLPQKDTDLTKRKKFILKDSAKEK
jgi:hypothetical protein